MRLLVPLPAVQCPSAIRHPDPLRPTSNHHRRPGRSPDSGTWRVPAGTPAQFHPAHRAGEPFTSLRPDRWNGGRTAFSWDRSVRLQAVDAHAIRRQRQWLVGSRTGAPPVGSSESGPTGHVSSPRLVKRSMRISRTTLSCLLRVKGYVAVRVGSAFRAAHSSRVLLHLFQPCPQCFRWVQPSPSRISSVSGPAVHRRLYHLASASLVAKVITDSGAASLHRRYPASLVLPTPPPPSRLSADFPVLPVIRPTFAPPISRRGEEGFSSCLARPRHRAVATTPPECHSASASLRYAMPPSSYGNGLGLRI